MTHCKEVVRSQEKKNLGRSEILMFAVELLTNSTVACLLGYVLNMLSNFTFHVSLEVLYDN